MRTVLTACVASVSLIATSPPVFAADMPVKAPPIIAPVWSWAGFYVGANAGVARSRTESGTYNGFLFPAILTTDPGGGLLLIPGTVGPLPASSGHDTSWLAGGQAGYLWQRDRVVFGVEADAVGTGLNGGASATATRFPGTTAAETVTVAYSTDIDWMVSIRGRLGYAADRLLLYVTGGGAFARINAGGTTTVTFGPGILVPAPGTYSLTSANTVARFGWTVGAGLEWAKSAAWRFGVEYRHTDFGRLTSTFQIPDGLGGIFATGTVNTRITVDQVTARANWAFAPR